MTELDMERWQRRVVGSMTNPTSQMCVCNKCGYKTVSKNGNCDILCSRCSSQMKVYSGVVDFDKVNNDPYGYN